MEALWQDVKYGARMLGKDRGVTLLAALTLALGIGANTTIFSVLHSVLLRPLPYEDPDRIVMVFEKRVRENTLTNVVSPADFLDWKSQNRSFSHLAAMSYPMVDLTGEGEPERIAAGQVTSEFFGALGVPPARGRLFKAGDEQPGHDNVVVLTHGLWQRRFAGNPAIVGKSIRLNGLPHTVIGILPAAFRFSDRRLDLWIPFAFPPVFRHVRAVHFLFVYGRLKPGVDLEQAQADMETLGANLERQYPNDNRGHRANVVPLREQLVGEIRPALRLLAGAVGFVLLIACANVANLLLARALGRQREMAVRQALGASRGRVVRQLLTESLMLSLAAGMVGTLLALWGVDLLKLLIPKNVNALGLREFGLNAPVLAFTAGLSFLTGMVFGLAPALQSSRSDPNNALKEGGRGATPGRSMRRLRSALVATEFALSLVLLTGAGLMIRTLLRLQEVNPGFNPQDVMTAPIMLPENRYREPLRTAEFFRQLAANLRATPGIEGVGMISHLPMSGQENRTGIAVEGYEPSSGEPTRAHHRIVSPGYFETMQIPLLEGRLFNERDTPRGTPVLLVNQTMAKKYWRGQSPIGRRVRLGGTEVWREVVGVVGDVKHWGLANQVNPEMYLPAEQTPTGFMNVVVRSSRGLTAVAAAMRAQLQALDEDQPMPTLATMEEVIAQSIASRRFLMVLLGIFAGAAILLAAVGTYGVMSYAVSQRRDEIGIRMALGAEPRDIFRLVIRQGMSLTLAGVATGLAGAFWLSKFLADMVFGVPPKDPLTFAGVATLLAFVSLAACWVPARRASKVDPMVALRYE
jgi:putative ABC transport system permease protein